MYLFRAIPLALALLAARAAAAQGCGWNSTHTFFTCDGSYNGSISGPAAPSLGDAIALNPAALPILPQPLGLEASVQSRSPPHDKLGLTAATIKGFSGFGVGLASWTEGSFPEPDFASHFQGTTYEAQYQQSLPGTTGSRLATSFAIPKVFLPRGVTLAVGAALAAGLVSGVVSPKFGLNLDVLGLSFGYDQSRDEISPKLPEIQVKSYSLGLQLGSLYAGFLRQSLVSAAGSSAAGSALARWTSPRWAAWYGVKWQKTDPRGWTRGGLEWHVGSHFHLGYEYGLYRYSHGLLSQLFF